MSAVRVVVIDCTVIGASPPTATLPTLIWRLLRRGARVGAGRVGRPRSMLIRPFIAKFQRESLGGSPTVQPNVCSNREQLTSASRCDRQRPATNWAASRPSLQIHPYGRQVARRGPSCAIGCGRCGVHTRTASGRLHHGESRVTPRPGRMAGGDGCRARSSSAARYVRRTGGAAARDPEAGRLYLAMVRQRRQSMQEAVQLFADAGALRRDVDVGIAGDLMWLYNDPSLYDKLVR
jgi:hypothetical protein